LNINPKKKNDSKFFTLMNEVKIESRKQTFNVNHKSYNYQKNKLLAVPEDWETSLFEEVFAFLTTLPLSRKELTYSSDGIFNVHYGDIHTGTAKKILDFEEEATNIPTIKDGVKRKKNIDFVSDGDLIMVDASEDYDGIGECIEVKNVQEKEVTAGLHTFLLRPRDGMVRKGFGAYVFKNELVSKELKRIATGASVLGISKKELAKILIPLPPLPEQRQIAEILSTWDRGIEKTEQLIAALERRKKGLMQQLLTGKVRFEEFEEQWSWPKAESLFDKVSRKNYDAPLLSVTQEYGTIPRDMLDSKVTMPTGETSSFKLVKPGNFLISLRSFQGGLEYSKYKGLVSPAYTVLEASVNICEDYYKHYFKCHHFVGRLAVAVIGIRDGKQISYEDFKSLRIPHPPLMEQQKIANALNTCDQEIDQWQKKLERLKKEKQGLIQQLLSGKTRVKTNLIN